MVQTTLEEANPINIANIDRSETHNPVSTNLDDRMDKAFGKAAESVLEGRTIPENVLKDIATDPNVRDAGMAGMNAAKEIIEEEKKVGV